MDLRDPLEQQRAAELCERYRAAFAAERVTMMIRVYDEKEGAWGTVTVGGNREGEMEVADHILDLATSLSSLLASINDGKVWISFGDDAPRVFEPGKNGGFVEMEIKRDT